MSHLYSKHSLHREIEYAADRAPIDLADDDRTGRTRALLEQARGASPTEVSEIHDTIVLLNIEVAESIASRYRNRGVPHEDLVQVACLGLVKAAQGFDPDKSDNFLSYAVPTMLGEVKRFFRDSAWAVKPPRRIQELQAELSATSSQLAQDTGHPPTSGELARSLGLEKSAVDEALAADGCYAPSSLERPSPNSEAGATLGDVLGGDDAGFDRAEAMVALRPLCRRLSERDRRIVYLRFFREWTQARIAEEFGVTQMQISRLLSRILSDLRDQLGDVDGVPLRRRLSA